MTKSEAQAEKATDEAPTADQIDVTALSESELETLVDEAQTELAQRRRDVDLDDADEFELVNDQWVKWGDISRHPNKKAVKPWIMQITGEHDKYGVDGDWLNKQTIDGATHMDVSGLESGDIIRVSGASHNNKKHKFWRVVANEGSLFVDGTTKAAAIEEVSD